MKPRVRAGRTVSSEISIMASRRLRVYTRLPPNGALGAQFFLQDGLSVANNVSGLEISEIAAARFSSIILFSSCKMIECFSSFLAFSPGSVHLSVANIVSGRKISKIAVLPRATKRPNFLYFRTSNPANLDSSHVG